MGDFFKEAAILKDGGESFVCVTLLAHKGHAPQDNGAKALVTASGLYWGTVGGGKVEAKAIAFAQEMLAQDDSRVELVKWNLQNDVGMTCGGEVDFLFESFSRSEWNLYVFGAGHVSQAFVRLLLTLNAKVMCFDHREEWLSKLPRENSKLECRQYSLEEDLNAVLPWDSKGFYIVMTQGHSVDLPILESLLQRGLPAYIGVIGSPVKGMKIKKALLERGIPSDYLEFLRCPIGLDLGTNDPAEIAVSVTAELLQCRDEQKSESRPL